MPMRSRSERREYSEDGEGGHRKNDTRGCEKLFHAHRSGVWRLGARSHSFLRGLRVSTPEVVDSGKPVLYLLPQHAHFEWSVRPGAVVGIDSGNVRVVLALLTRPRS